MAHRTPDNARRSDHDLSHSDDKMIGPLPSDLVVNQHLRKHHHRDNTLESAEAEIENMYIKQGNRPGGIQYGATGRKTEPPILVSKQLCCYQPR
jgi:hypothetical protein